MLGFKYIVKFNISEIHLRWNNDMFHLEKQTNDLLYLRLNDVFNLLSFKKFNLIFYFIFLFQFNHLSFKKFNLIIYLIF